MRIQRVLTFTGLAVALAGVTAVAAAERQPVHVMTVQLPDGAVEQIRYTGQTAPRILVRDDVAPLAMEGFFDTAFGPGSPFAELDRISAEMDRQAAAMMQQAALMSEAGPDAVALRQAALAGQPKGATSYTMVSTSNGQGVCTRSVRVISMGAGQAPKVERSASGACGTAAAPAATTPAPIPHNSI